MSYHRYYDRCNDRESSGVAKAGLTTGIIGTTLGVLKDGGLHGLLGGGNYGHGHGHKHGGCDDHSGMVSYREFTDYVIGNERHLGLIESKLACVEVETKKNEEIALLRDKITRLECNGYTDRQTCHKLDAELHYAPRQIAVPAPYPYPPYPFPPCPPFPCPPVTPPTGETG